MAQPGFRPSRGSRSAIEGGERVAPGCSLPRSVERYLVRFSRKGEVQSRPAKRILLSFRGSNENRTPGRRRR